MLVNIIKNKKDNLRNLPDIKKKDLFDSREIKDMSKINDKLK